VKKIALWFLVVLLMVLVVAVVGSSFYMLDYALAPDAHRTDTDSMYHELFSDYPETQPWVDSLQRVQGLSDTMISMPGNYRCHAYYINTGSQCTALVIHGWRGQAIKFFYLAQMYERSLGYNVVIPDVYAHGQSDGESIRMGWLDRLDMLRWMEVFQTDTMVVHGVSMGAATTMMLSGEQMPADIKDLRFVEDCGYTSVWDEFQGQLKADFGLPAFPLLYTSSMLCDLLNSWSFSEASAIQQLSSVRYPMLFIHGDKDTFVPTEMVYRLYKAKPQPKALWITGQTGHAQSYRNHRNEYIEHVRNFLQSKH